jgi:hypothetical protein
MEGNMGLFNFVTSLCVLALMVFAILCRRQYAIKYALHGMLLCCVVGWYENIFLTGTGFLFILGTLALVVVVSALFYTLYSGKSNWLDQS